jgi:hypothetical protein
VCVLRAQRVVLIAFLSHSPIVRGGTQRVYRC